MAEIRNTFVKSKMNKDLDDRLLSKGEYRNAENVQISRSEGEDVGALENVLGNNLITNWGLNNIANLEIIGYTVDQTNDRAFFIATNYTDVSDSELDNPAPYGASCYILMFDNKAIDNVDKYKILVQGRFLNFSKTHPVFGINLIEDLLFWTDNRNQPRKINIIKAIADNTYYTTEDQISLAKFMPYSVPRLYSDITLTGVYSFTGGGSIPANTLHYADDVTNLRVGMQAVVTNKIYGGSPGYTMPVYVSSVDYTNNTFRTLIDKQLGTSAAKETIVFRNGSSANVTDQYLSPSAYGKVSSITSTQIQMDGTSGSVSTRINPNMLVTSTSLKGGEVKTTTNGYSAGSNVAVTVDFDPTSGNNNLAVGDLVFFSQPNPNYDSSWPGDKDFLRDKFVRFAYRFKFIDGEYSLISPFTQSVFIPKQDGYFESKQTPESSSVLDRYQQENQTATSTVVNFFENSVQNVNLFIEMPFVVNELASKLLIEEIEIIYKESDGLALQVVETIPVTDPSITSNNTTLFNFLYQSKKPFRTLPEKELLRVFDKVPIRAQTQSAVGNRLIYGNIINKHTPPQFLKYNVAINEKYQITGDEGVSNGCRNAYPTHSVKQNRTYQVGIVLADRYGRQSDVILSELNADQFSQTTGSTIYDSSSVYHPYYSAFVESTNNSYDRQVQSGRWRGDSIKILFRDIIPETVTYADGYPGLYKSGEYTAIATPAVSNSTTVNLQSGTLDPNVAVGDIITGPASGGGTFTTSIKSVNHTTSTITVVDSISIDNNETVNIHGPSNNLGWYTYKIVVKQLEQDYYNVYLPNLLNQEPFSTGATVVPNGQVSYTTIFSDNINKIPSELEEVQPEQTLFGTNKSLLYPIVSQIQTVSGGAPSSIPNVRVSLGQDFINANQIGKLVDLGLNTNTSGVTEAIGIYNAKQNPQTVIFSTYDNVIGANAIGNYGSGDFFTSYRMAVLETEPTKSRLEIFYETSTSGLVSELNQQIIDSPNGSGAISPDPPPNTETE